MPEDRFNLVGGLWCLDFVNTLDGARAGSYDERLSRYEDLVAWCRQVGMLTPAQARRVVQRAARRPAEGRQIVARAVALREAVYAILLCLLGGKRAPPRDLGLLNEELARAMCRARLKLKSGELTWGWDGLDETLDGLLGPIGRSAAELMTSDDLRRVRQCTSERCDWMFLDVSKNSSRRWCDMKSCGNREKVRAHRRRHAGGAA